MILNIVICYNNIDEVCMYIRNTRQLLYGNLIRFVVVVNAIQPEKKKVLDEINLSDYIDIYISEKNLGYMNGFIYGFEQYCREQHSLTVDWIILSNTDITYPDNLFLDYFLNQDYDRDVWCVGPSIYVDRTHSYSNPSSIERRSLKKIDQLIGILANPITGSIYMQLSKMKHMLIKRKKTMSRNVYEVHGCYFFLRREFVELMMRNRYRAFLYSEEAYIAELAYINNKHVFYDANFEVHHNEHSVTKKINYSQRAKLISESLKIIREDFYKKGEN